MPPRRFETITCRASPFRSTALDSYVAGAAPATCWELRDQLESCTIVYNLWDILYHILSTTYYMLYTICCPRASRPPLGSPKSLSPSSGSAPPPLDLDRLATRASRLASTLAVAHRTAPTVFAARAEKQTEEVAASERRQDLAVRSGMASHAALDRTTLELREKTI